MSDEPILTSDELVLAAEAKLQTISSALHDLLNIAGQINQPEPLLAILYELRDVRSQLSSTKTPGVYQQIEELVFPVMGEKKVKVEPFGEFTSRKGMKRSGWRYADLLPVLVARALDERVFDPATGEATEREGETVARVLVDCLQFNGAKVGGLRSRGLKPADFCVEEPKAWQLELPKRVSDEDAPPRNEIDREAAA